MKKVSQKEYYERLGKFVNKHRVENIVTRAFENNGLIKEYVCEDGAIGWEANRKIYETRKVEVVEGLIVKVTIELLETKWWDTDDSISIYMYERY